MSVIERFQNTSVGKRAAAIAAAIVVATGPLAILGWAAVSRSSEGGGSMLGAGAVFVAISTFVVGCAGAYNRFSRACLSVLGAIAGIFGFSFAGGGLAKLVLPHLNYLGVWGVLLLIVAVLAAVFGLYLHLLVRGHRKRTHTRMYSEQIERRDTLARDEALRVAVIIACSGVVLSVIGLLT
jgi:hypothetical protein